MSLAEAIQMSFINDGLFCLSEAYERFPEKPSNTIRGRIYDNLGIRFERVSKGIYRTIGDKGGCILVEGDGRKLDMLDDESIDCIVCDHPWDCKSNKGGNRNFANKYDCFNYTLEDFKEKARVLKDGHFLVEILPTENANNYDYLYQIKVMAKKCGLNYYASIPWKKGNFVANTGRSSKNTEQILFLFKGNTPRKLRIDFKKSKAADREVYMAGTNGMLPTNFDVQPVPKNKKIHQSEKPVALYERILSYIACHGDLVLDQYAGSGALGEAALNYGLNCILIEKLKENIKKIKERLSLDYVIAY
ncbi:MAG: DNA-methyltransferase [Clostridium paraputrificum]|uniref:DNA-methyltransferase n=1 Tax=Clostridium sp. TaxID=1506 RepID=UPI0025C09819|nr:site-specific DNA-methyltransferase [Clostridium sp.]MBS5926161.1 site-specific DNA-methyltransferase [Clostridium sp.]